MNMKKKILIPMALVICATFASCDTKLCYCYENGQEQTMYISTDLPCNTQSTDTRGCVEQNERMDPGTTAWK